MSHLIIITLWAFIEIKSERIFRLRLAFVLLILVGITSIQVINGSFNLLLFYLEFMVVNLFFLRAHVLQQSEALIRLVIPITVINMCLSIFSAFKMDSMMVSVVILLFGVILLLKVKKLTTKKWFNTHLVLLFYTVIYFLSFVIMNIVNQNLFTEVGENTILYGMFMVYGMYAFYNKEVYRNKYHFIEEVVTNISRDYFLNLRVKSENLALIHQTIEKLEHRQQETLKTYCDQVDHKPFSNNDQLEVLLYVFLKENNHMSYVHVDHEKEANVLFRILIDLFYILEKNEWSQKLHISSKEDGKIKVTFLEDVRFENLKKSFKLYKKSNKTNKKLLSDFYYNLKKYDLELFFAYENNQCQLRV